MPNQNDNLSGKTMTSSMDTRAAQIFEILKCFKCFKKYLKNVSGPGNI